VSDGVLLLEVPESSVANAAAAALVKDWVSEETGDELLSLLLLLFVDPRKKEDILFPNDTNAIVKGQQTID
jgi:hypothetical protein